MCSVCVEKQSRVAVKTRLSPSLLSHFKCQCSYVTFCQLHAHEMQFHQQLCAEITVLTAFMNHDQSITIKYHNGNK